MTDVCLRVGVNDSSRFAFRTNVKPSCFTDDGTGVWWAYFIVDALVLAEIDSMDDLLGQGINYELVFEHSSTCSTEDKTEEE